MSRPPRHGARPVHRARARDVPGRARPLAAHAARQAARPARRARRRARQVRRLRPQVLRDLPRGRRLHADLGLAVRRRRRAPDPRPRARPLRRGEARRGSTRSCPVFIPFLGAYVALRNARFDPWVNARVALAGPIAGGLAALGCLAVGASRSTPTSCARSRTPASSSTSSTSCRSGSSTAATCCRSWRVLRAGRRRDQPVAGAAARERRRAPSRSRRSRRSCSGWSPRTCRRTACEREPARARPAASPADARDVHAGRLADRVRVPRRLPGRRPDRPARRLDLRLGAGRGGVADVRGGARDRRGSSPRPGLAVVTGGGPGRDGGGEPRREGGAAASRSASTSSSRTSRA